MNTYIYLLILLVIIIVSISIKKPKRTGTFPYEKQKSLLTKTEHAFYIPLKNVATKENLTIMSKVRLWDIIRVSKGTEKRVSFENKIKAKHLDFVLCDEKNMEIILVIELDDKSHMRKDRVISDEFKNKALEHAKIPLLRITPQKNYDEEQLLQKIIDKIK